MSRDAIGLLVPDGYVVSSSSGRALKLLTQHYVVSKEEPGPAPGPATRLDVTVFHNVFSDTLMAKKKPLEVSQVRPPQC